PHCGTSFSIQACCTLCNVPFSASPSIVVTFLAPTALTGTEQERVATPSMWTVQAPHWAIPQPYFVPVRPTASRNTHKRGVRGSTSAWYPLPLTLRDTIAYLSLTAQTVSAGRQPISPLPGRP